MFGNSIIPTRSRHDRHYAHRCIRCDTPFGRHSRPAGEIQSAGEWGDGCEDCHARYLAYEARDATSRHHAVPHLMLAGAVI